MAQSPTHSAFGSMGSDDIYDVGNCEEHSRPNEAFCEPCRVVICPNCLMFGSHIDHPVSPLYDAARNIRSNIDGLNKTGKLAPDYCDSFLKGVSEAAQRADNLQKTVLQDLDARIDNLTQTLKQRREGLCEEIAKHFQEQSDIIDQHIQVWEQKEKIAARLLSLYKNSSDVELLVNSQEILAGVDSLEQPISFKSTRLLTRVDTKVEGMEFEEALEALSKFGSFGDHKAFQFKA